MTSSTTVTIDASHAGDRVDEALAQLLGLSGQAVKRLCADGLVTRRGVRLRKGDRLATADVVTVHAMPVNPAVPETLPVLFESAAYVVVDKPAGMASHKLRPSDPPAALDSVALRWPAVATAGPDPREGGLLHRLDVGTSGALAFALTPHAFEDGRTAFRTGRARKLYLALCHGALAPHGVVDVPVAHDPADPRRSVTVELDTRHRGKPRDASTSWRVLFSRGEDHLVLVDAQGGRRHQVRVHLAHVGAPLWGDDLYGGPAWPASGPALPSHALHALWLEFAGAQTLVRALAPPPPSLRDVVEHLLGSGGSAVLAQQSKAPPPTPVTTGL